MEFINEFRVPSDIDTTFATLTDLEKVAPCLPGAVLEEVDGATYTGRVKVKVGPVQVTYRGTAKMVEADSVNKTGRIEAAGKETRGTGTANADVVATLVEDGDGTLVKVVTDLNVTGKPAQFGRGVMAEVGAKIIDAFAERLREMMEAGEKVEVATGPTVETEPPTSPAADVAEGTEAGPEAVATGAAAAGPRRIAEDPHRADDALDLMEVAGAATLKRVIPLVALLLAVIGLVWWRRSR